MSLEILIQWQIFPFFFFFFRVHFEKQLFLHNSFSNVCRKQNTYSAFSRFCTAFSSTFFSNSNSSNNLSCFDNSRFLTRLKNNSIPQNIVNLEFAWKVKSSSEKWNAKYMLSTRFNPQEIQSRKFFIHIRSSPNLIRYLNW